MQEDWGKALRSLFGMVLEDMADLQQIKSIEKERGMSMYAHL